MHRQLGSTHSKTSPMKHTHVGMLPCYIRYTPAGNTENIIRRAAVISGLLLDSCVLCRSRLYRQPLSTHSLLFWTAYSRSEQHVIAEHPVEKYTRHLSFTPERVFRHGSGMSGVPLRMFTGSRVWGAPPRVYGGPGLVCLVCSPGAFCILVWCLLWTMLVSSGVFENSTKYQISIY